MSESKIREIEERRARRREDLERQKAEQYAVDLEALDELEQEYGYGRVAVIEVNDYVPGLPTFAVVRSPGGTSYYKRYTDMVRRAGKNLQAVGAAQDMLGDSCIVYPPEGPERTKMYEAFPGLKVSASIRAIKFVELEEFDEKKG